MNNFVSLGVLRESGLFLFAIFVVVGALAYFTRWPFGGICLILFGLVAGIHGLYRARWLVAIDHRVVTTISPRGRRFQLAWSDVIAIDLNGDGDLLLRGDDKRLVIPAVHLWTGVPAPETRRILWEEINRRGLRPVRRFRAEFIVSNHNVDVDDAT